ncbi:hypothetical protein BDA96_10G054600 [Sorghum bicolor]|uniref:Uncharacterized protein n=1 Tax=Sorghum bicolor TaxID=4558 RepID=A0A921Q331_SORBI|nr:hypothetical protein BDA96_10G054600 [Sorghum bicolor]
MKRPNKRYGGSDFVSLLGACEERGMHVLRCGGNP